MSQVRLSPAGATGLTIDEDGIVVALPHFEFYLEVQNARVWGRTGDSTLAASTVERLEDVAESPTGVWVGEDDSFAAGAIHEGEANQETHTHIALRTATATVATCKLRRRSR